MAISAFSPFSAFFRLANGADSVRIPTDLRGIERHGWAVPRWPHSSRRITSDTFQDDDFSGESRNEQSVDMAPVAAQDQAPVKRPDHRRGQDPGLRGVDLAVGGYAIYLSPSPWEVVT